MALSAQVGSEEFHGVVGIVEDLPEWAQISFVAAFILLVGVFIWQRKAPVEKTTTKPSDSAIAITALANSIQQAGEKINSAETQAEAAEKEAAEAKGMVREVCEMILDEPPPETASLRSVARDVLKRMKA